MLWILCDTLQANNKATHSSLKRGHRKWYFSPKISIYGALPKLLAARPTSALCSERRAARRKLFSDPMASKSKKTLLSGDSLHAAEVRTKAALDQRDEKSIAKVSLLPTPESSLSSAVFPQHVGQPAVFR